VRQLLMAGDLDMGHARALLAMPSAQQVLAAQQVVARQLSVRQAEALVVRLQRSSEAGGATRPKAKSRDVARLEERLADALAAAVEIRVKRRTARGEQGEIAIRFDSLDELNGLLDKLGAGEG
jgi:ParB family chromosome partitioning protein